MSAQQVTTHRAPETAPARDQSAAARQPRMAGARVLAQRRRTRTRAGTPCQAAAPISAAPAASRSPCSGASAATATAPASAQTDRCAAAKTPTAARRRLRSERNASQRASLRASGSIIAAAMTVQAASAVVYGGATGWPAAWCPAGWPVPPSRAYHAMLTAHAAAETAISETRGCIQRSPRAGPRRPSARVDADAPGTDIGTVVDLAGQVHGHDRHRDGACVPAHGRAQRADYTGDVEHVREALAAARRVAL